MDSDAVVRICRSYKLNLVKKKNKTKTTSPKNPNLKRKLQRHVCVAYSGFRCFIFYCFTDPYVNVREVHVRVAFPQRPFRSVDVGK